MDAKWLNDWILILSPYEYWLHFMQRSLYGCCEDLTRKLDDVFTISNLHQVNHKPKALVSEANISPFADVDRCAENFRKDCIFSWKPHPSRLVGDFDPERIKDNIQHALEVTKDFVFEIVLKDTP